MNKTFDKQSIPQLSPDEARLGRLALEALSPENRKRLRSVCRKGIHEIVNKTDFHTTPNEMLKMIKHVYDAVASEFFDILEDFPNTKQAFERVSGFALYTAICERYPLGRNTPNDPDVFAYASECGDAMWDEVFLDMAMPYWDSRKAAHLAARKACFGNHAQKKIIGKLRRMIREFSEEPLSPGNGVEMLTELTALWAARERLEKIRDVVIEIIRGRIESKGGSFDEYKNIDGLAYLPYVVPQFSGKLFSEVMRSVEHSAKKEVEKTMISS